jgi:hypothetical protein
MKHSTTKRVATTATAAIAALALGVSAAGAQTSAGPAVYAGDARALSLNLTLTGPDQLLGPITDGGDTLTLTVSSTGAVLESNGTASVLAKLLGGFGATLGSQLDAPSQSSTEDVDTTEQVIAQSAGPLTIEAGTVRTLLDRSAGISTSSSELAGIVVNLGPLLAELPPEVAAGLQQVVDEATANVNTLVGELNGGLDQLEEALNSVTEQSPIDIPEILPEDLPLVPDVTEVDLVSIRVLSSTSTVQTIDGLVRATSTGAIADAELLGGLVSVPVIEFSSLAETAGTPGTARSEATVTTIAVEVGDTLVSIDGTVITVGDLTIDLADPQFEGLPLEDVLGPIRGVLGELLNAVGLSVLQADETTTAAADGSSATASTTAFAVRLVPLAAAVGDDAPLDVNLEFAPTSAVVSAAPFVAAAAPPDPEEPALPRTGGGLLATLLGSLAMGGALTLCRRG